MPCRWTKQPPPQEAKRRGPSAPARQCAPDGRPHAVLPLSAAARRSVDTPVATPPGRCTARPLRRRNAPRRR
eukprot:2876412-Lingulodinium_polyedra.AAC.1